MAHSGGMATPLDPDRWDDFAKPVPPSPTARRTGIVNRETRTEQTNSPTRSSKVGTSDAAVPPRYAIGGAGVALGLIVVLALFAGGSDRVTATSVDVTEPSVVVAAEPSTDAKASAPAAATEEVPSGPQSAMRAEAPISWAAVLASLDEARQKYLATGATEVLASYAKAGSPVAVRDAATQQELRALGASPTGMSVKILEVSESSINESVAELTVADELSAYQIVHTESGKVIETRDARPVTPWRVRLERVEDRWVLAEVERG